MDVGRQLRSGWWQVPPTSQKGRCGECGGTILKGSKMPGGKVKNRSLHTRSRQFISHKLTELFKTAHDIWLKWRHMKKGV